MLWIWLAKLYSSGKRFARLNNEYPRTICVGCAGIQKHRSPESIIATHKLVNRDGDVAEWQERMETEGFECKMIENGTFSTTYRKNIEALPGQE